MTTLNSITPSSVHDLLFGTKATQRNAARQLHDDLTRFDVARYVWSEDGKDKWPLPTRPSFLLYCAVDALINNERGSWWELLCDILESVDVTTVIQPQLLRAVESAQPDDRDFVARALKLLFSRFKSSFRPNIDAMARLVQHIARSDDKFDVDLDSAAFWLDEPREKVDNLTTAVLQSWINVMSRSTNQTQIFTTTTNKLLPGLISLWLRNSKSNVGLLACQGICHAVFHSEHVCGYAEAIEGAIGRTEPPTKKARVKTSYHRTLFESLSSVSADHRLPAIPMLFNGFLFALDRTDSNADRSILGWYRFSMKSCDEHLWALQAVLERVKFYNVYRMGADDSPWYIMFKELFDETVLPILSKSTQTAIPLLKLIGSLDYRIIEPHLCHIWQQLWKSDMSDQSISFHVECMSLFSKLRRVKGVLGSQMIALKSANGEKMMESALFIDALHKAIAAVAPGELPYLFESLFTATKEALSSGDWQTSLLILAHSIGGQSAPTTTAMAQSRMDLMNKMIHELVAPLLKKHAGKWQVLALLLALRHSSQLCLPFLKPSNKTLSLLALGHHDDCPRMKLCKLEPQNDDAKLDVVWVALALDRVTELVHSDKKKHVKEMQKLVTSVFGREMKSGCEMVMLETVTAETKPYAMFQLVMDHLPMLTSFSTAIVNALVDGYMRGDWAIQPWFLEIQSIRQAFIEACLDVPLVSLLASLPSGYLAIEHHVRCAKIGLDSIEERGVSDDAITLILRAAMVAPLDASVTDALLDLHKRMANDTALITAIGHYAEAVTTRLLYNDDFKVIQQMAWTFMEATVDVSAPTAPLEGIAGLFRACLRSLLACRPPSDGTVGDKPKMWKHIHRCVEMVDQLLWSMDIPLVPFQDTAIDVSFSVHVMNVAEQYLHLRTIVDAWQKSDWCVGEGMVGAFWNAALKQQHAPLVGAILHRIRDISPTADRMLLISTAMDVAMLEPVQEGLIGLMHGTPREEIGSLLRFLRYEMGVVSMKRSHHAAMCLHAAMSALKGRRARVLAVVTRPTLLAIIGLLSRASEPDLLVLLVDMMAWILTHEMACPFESDELMLVLQAVTVVLEKHPVISETVFNAVYRAISAALNHRTKQVTRAPAALVTILRLLLGFVMPKSPPLTPTDSAGSMVAGFLPRASTATCKHPVAAAENVGRLYELLSKPGLRGPARKFAAFLVSDYCVAIKSTDPQPLIRKALRSGIFAVMDTLTDFEFQQLSRASDAASRAIFKHIHTQFTKQQYRGKV